MRLHPVSHRDNHVQVVIANVIAFSVRRSSSEIPNNCFFAQFAVLKHMLNMLANARTHSTGEKQGAPHSSAGFSMTMWIPCCCRSLWSLLVNKRVSLPLVESSLVCMDDACRFNERGWKPRLRLQRKPIQSQRARAGSGLRPRRERTQPKADDCCTSATASRRRV
jgi:hypothetical protein